MEEVLKSFEGININPIIYSPRATPSSVSDNKLTRSEKILLTKNKKATFVIHIGDEIYNFNSRSLKLSKLSGDSSRAYIYTIDEARRHIPDFDNLIDKQQN